MNNTEKLLRAFIEAQGFDVEEVKVRSNVPIKKELGELAIFHGRSSDLESHGGEYVRGPEECYYTTSKTAIDYKVTKRASYAGVYLPTAEDMFNE